MPDNAFTKTTEIQSLTHTALVMNYVVTVLYCYERFIDSTFKFGEACMLRNGLLKLASIPYILK